MSAIDEQNAGYFSKAAYAPIGTDADYLLPDYLDVFWDDISTDFGTDAYSAAGINQFRVFVNETEEEVVFAFKGTSTFQEFKSDLTDSGASQYARLHDLAETMYENLSLTYEGYEFFVDGHSLGGGMAQSFALEFDLDGFAQNSLPIATDTINGYFTDINAELASYAATNDFVGTNVSGDPATLVYSTLGGQLYLDPAPTTLPSVYSAGVILGGIATALGFGAFGLPLIATSMWGAHQIDSVIDLAAGYPVGPNGRLMNVAGETLPSMADQWAQLRDEVASIGEDGSIDYIVQTDGERWEFEDSVDPFSLDLDFIGAAPISTLALDGSGSQGFSAQWTSELDDAYGSVIYNEDDSFSVLASNPSEQRTQNYAADSFLDSESWDAPDGSHGGAIYERDGSYHTEIYNADGTWSKEDFVASSGIYTTESLDAEGTHTFFTRYPNLSTLTESFYADGVHSVSTTTADGSYTNRFEDPDGWFEESYDASRGQYLNSYSDSAGIFHGSEVRNADGSSHMESYRAGGAFEIRDTGADGSTRRQWRNEDGSHGDRTVQADGAFVENHHFADGRFQTWVQQANGDFQAEVYDPDGRLAEEMWRSGMDNPALVETGRTIYYPDGRFHSEVRKPFEGWAIRDGQREEDGSYTAHTISQFGGAGDEAYDAETGGLTTRYWPGEGLYSLVRNDADGTERQQYVSVFDSHITAYDTLPDGLGQTYMHDSFAGLQLSKSDSDGSSMLVMRNDGSFEITQFVDSFTRVAYNERRAADGAWSLGLDAADGSSHSIVLDPSPIAAFPVFSESSEDAASGRRTIFELSPGGGHSSSDASAAHLATSSDAAGNQAITLSMQDGSGGASLVRNAAPEPGDPLAFFGDFHAGGTRHWLTQSVDGRWTLEQAYGPGMLSSILSSTGERRFVLNGEGGTTVTLASQVFPGSSALQLTARALDGGGLHQGTLTEFGGPNSVGVSVFGSSVEVSTREISPGDEVPYAVSWEGLDGSEVFASINLDGSGFGQSRSADGSTWAGHFFLDGSVVASWAAVDGSFGDESYSASSGVWVSSYQYADGAFGSATLSGDGNLLAERHDADGGYALYSIGATGAIYLERHNADGTRQVKALGADRSLNSTFGDAGGEIETQSYDPATGEYQRDYQYSDEHRGTIARGSDGSLHSDLHFADGTHSVVDISATGDTHSEYYGADGALELGEGTTAGADGSYGIRGSMSGASITQLFDADGVLLRTSWEREDGSSGDATFNPDDTVATSEWTRVFEDGTYTMYAKGDDGWAHMDYFSADDTLLGSYWASPDGTYGEDSSAEDGSSYSVVHTLDDESQVTLETAEGLLEQFVYDAFGNLIQADVSGGEGDDVLRAVDGHGNTLVGGPGNDILIGADGDDTYVFNLGDGIDTIIDEQGIFGANSIVFGDGITPEMLSLELGSLLIRVGDGGDAIHLERFDPANAEAGADVARFEFADGSELSYAQLIERGFDISGTSGDDTIDGTSVSDRMEGGLGSDTYRFGAGSGADAIREAASESDTDVLEVQANSDAVTVSREGDALVLGLTGTPDRVAVDWFADRAARLESVRFLDGETWDAATFQAQAGNAAPSVANPIGEQSFEAGAPFTFTVPEGTFADEDPSTLQLGATLFGGGALPAWLSFDAQTATFSGNPAKKQNGISRVVVTATDADGESVAAEFGLVIHAKAGSNVNGSNGDDILYGGSGDETLSAKDGNDALFGGEGNDLLKGATGQDVLQGGEGSDTLRGGKGQNLLDGGSGDDVLYGGQGSSLIVGGSGNDTIRTGQGSDVILFNRGDGSDTVIADREGNNTLSFGGGIRYSDLELSRSGKDLVISAGGDDQVVLKNWYGGKRSVTNLQIVLDDYDPDCADPMQNRQVQTFDFLGLVSTFDQARKATPGVTSWAISNALLQFHLAGADDLALGGDLAYWYAKNRGLGGISLAAAQQVIGAAGFGADAQSLRPFGGLQEGFVKLT